MNAVNAGRHAIPVETQWELDEFAPAQRPYHGRHRAEDVVNLGKYRRLEKYGLESTERPPSPTYSFTLVEQPGGEG